MNRQSDLMDLVVRARMRSVPVLMVATQDPVPTMALVREAAKRAAGLEGAPRKAADDRVVAVCWDAARGLRGLGASGREFVAAAGFEGCLDPAGSLTALLGLPKEGLAFFLNAHRFVEDREVSQAIWNLRDPFKSDGRTLVLLSPVLRLPPELSQDVPAVEEPLPGEEELRQTALSTWLDAGLDAPGPAVLESCAQACAGMTAFAAEQALALSLKRDGMALERLWGHKKRAVEQTPGLSFSMGGEGFPSLGGLSQAKRLGAGLFSGPRPPRCVVRLDELEKQLAGSQGDLSGVSQDFNAVLLRAMQDNGWSGIVAAGPPGSGKSAFSKALGAEFGVPTLEIDLGAAKGSLVGESEANVRAAMRVISAVSAGGDAFFVATVNSITSLPAELRRRFRYGAMMFDLPSPEEREPIWRMYLERFGLAQDAPRPPDECWTGADVYNCCELAWRLGTDLLEAAGFLLPVARSAPEQVRRLRELADGRFLSASYPGPYRMPDDAVTPALQGGRKIGLEED